MVNTQEIPRSYGVSRINEKWPVIDLLGLDKERLPRFALTDSPYPLVGIFGILDIDLPPQEYKSLPTITFRFVDLSRLENLGLKEGSVSPPVSLGLNQTCILGRGNEHRHNLPGAESEIISEEHLFFSLRLNDNPRRTEELVLHVQDRKSVNGSQVMLQNTLNRAKLAFASKPTDPQLAPVPYDQAYPNARRLFATGPTQRPAAA